MADRKFERRSIQHGDRMISVQVIACAVEGCGEEYALPDVGRSAMPPDAVSAKARREGWKVGRGASRDRCPTHARNHRPHQEEPEDMTVNGRNHGGAGRTIGEIYKEEPTVPANTRQVLDTHTIDKGGVVTLHKSAILVDDPLTPPRTMDREEKRILFGELDAAYQDAEHGYKPGHTDKSVAEALGVPVVWVRQLREEMFGPAEGDKATKKIIELHSRLDKLDAKIIDAADIVAKLMTEAQGARLELNNLQRKG